MFVAKYDANGNCIWAKQANGNPYAHGEALSLNSNGEVFITGGFRGSAFGNLNSIYNNNWGFYSEDIFVAKYDSNGNLLWAKQAGGLKMDEGRTITTDEDGNCYVAGNIESLALFGENADTVNVNGGYSGFFLAKYDNNGYLQWVTYNTSTSNTASFIGGVEMDSRKNIYITGSFIGSMTIGDTIITITNGSGLVMKFDQNGKFKWVVQSVKNQTYAASCSSNIALDNENNCYITGSFHGSFLFGNINLITNPTSNGMGDIFIAKIKDNELETTSIKELSTSNNILNVYPNPTPGLFQISFNSEGINSAVINIIDAKGQTVYHKVFQQIQPNFTKTGSAALTTSIDLSKEAKGIYFIEIIADDKKIVKKIALE